MLQKNHAAAQAAFSKFYAAAKYTTFVKGKPRSGKAAAAKE